MTLVRIISLLAFGRLLKIQGCIEAIYIAISTFVTIWNIDYWTRRSVILFVDASKISMWNGLISSRKDMWKLTNKTISDKLKYKLYTIWKIVYICLIHFYFYVLFWFQQIRCILINLLNARFTLDEGADIVWLQVKYFEKSRTICPIFTFYGWTARALRYECICTSVKDRST